MRKEVTVEELREKPEELIAAIERGEGITITRDGKAIGTVSPADGIIHRGVRYPFRNFDFGSRPKNLTSDVTELIREDRDSELKKFGL